MNVVCGGRIENDVVLHIITLYNIHIHEGLTVVVNNNDDNNKWNS